MPNGTACGHWAPSTSRPGGDTGRPASGQGSGVFRDPVKEDPLKEEDPLTEDALTEDALTEDPLKGDLVPGEGAAGGRLPRAIRACTCSSPDFLVEVTPCPWLRDDRLGGWPAPVGT